MTYMVWMPEMVPVSYPYRIPAKAANNPTRMAGHDEPGTSSGFLIAIPILEEVELS